ncbi:MAG: AAA family ATPase, partial [Aeromicrobium sp.]
AQRLVDDALAKLHESDATMTAIAADLGSFGSQHRAAKGEADRLAAAIVAAEEARDTDLSGLADLESRLQQAESVPDEDPDTSLLDELSEVASSKRRAETEARLVLRTNEERTRALEGQATALFAAAEAEREARQKAAERRDRQRHEAETARAVVTASDQVLARLDRSIQRASERRTEIEHSRSGREDELRTVRGRLRELSSELDSLTSSVHRDEMARAELRLRLESLETRALEDLGLGIEALVGEYGPDQLVPPLQQVADADVDDVASEPEAARPFDREEQTKLLRSAERSLAMLGKVNPLALEEFSALEERHQFLSGQVEDLRKTRQDLLEIVDEVDAKVEKVFTEAWHDTEREFRDVFSRLFPGGEGRLVLTDPDNMLTTGIDVEARPPGKKVKRLSLLSGGERSLVAVAFLVALFKARPSPFYILDEVEAALDDTNLGRLLGIYEELRASSQLIVITHQKRTMEVGDALYGVSMRGDGVSAVISQRLREEETA